MAVGVLCYYSSAKKEINVSTKTIEWFINAKELCGT